MRIDIRAKDFDLVDALRDQVERRIRFALTRCADRLDGVTVRIEQRVLRGEGDARYVCEVEMIPARLRVHEEHDRVETAIDRALDRAVRLATPRSLRHPPALGGGREVGSRSIDLWFALFDAATNARRSRRWRSMPETSFDATTLVMMKSKLRADAIPPGAHTKSWRSDRPERMLLRDFAKPNESARNILFVDV